MSLAGRWRIVAMPDYVEDYPDMMEPAYIEFVLHPLGGLLHRDLLLRKESHHAST